ncbi:hypothetical protein BST97_04375 [Nonlabens spongiae]|uniref:DUF1206 domain-containing protein n=1 Tax=Nonlabens spongiae TaxID=331648 RepID=A0A1W6MI39_9FLAO|nr:DUF1206 domain-containing protein [Nonlabens spongiae]ARN77278.1 hypothetical protein BST97_04375 [Nonlabens spongiae]
MSSKKETFAKFGIFTKGAVYLLVGGLTAYSAFQSDGGATGSNDALQYISSQPFGQIILGLMTLGIFAFAAWRVYLAIKNPEGRGESDKKSTVRRIAYAVSALGYSTLGIYGVNLLLNVGGSSGGGSWLGSLMQNDWGKYVVVFIALCLAGKAIYEFYRAFSGKFKDKVQNAELDRKAQEFLVKAGKWGFTARGVVIGVLAFLFAKAAMSSNASKAAGGTKNALQFISQEGGTIVMGIVAAGLTLYGVYLLASSRYRNMPIQ